MSSRVRILGLVFVAATLHAADSRAARLWSLQPVNKPAVPPGAANPIDAFIKATYQEKGLHPSAKADKLVLLRRVYFDLIGIPPTIAEQDAFLKDEAPDAYE